jgi:hypothetical protein
MHVGHGPIAEAVPAALFSDAIRNPIRSKGVQRRSAIKLDLPSGQTISIGSNRVCSAGKQVIGGKCAFMPLRTLSQRF